MVSKEWFDNEIKKQEKQRIDHADNPDVEIKRPPSDKRPVNPPLPDKPEGQKVRRSEGQKVRRSEGQKDTCTIEPIKTDYLKPESKK